MDSCLLCLKINSDMLNCIRADSKRWQELNILNTIEKHFWPLSTIQSNSWICPACWQVVDDFHKFYLRTEEAHLKLVIKLEKVDDNEVCSQKCAFGQNAKDLEADVNVKNEPVDSDENLGSVSSAIERVDKTQADNNDVDKIKNDTVGKSRKRKHSKEEILDLKNTAGGYKVLAKIRKRLADFIASDSVSDSDYDDTDINSLSDTNTSEDDDKYYDTNLLSREENDKIIADYFKQINCDICKIPLDNFFGILKHFFEIHQLKGYILCCKRKFFNRSDLVKHIRGHSNPNQFKCVQCNKFFANRALFEEHKLHAHSKVVIAKKYSCDVCGKYFQNIQTLKMHKLSHLSKEEKISYQDCGKSSLQNFNLKLYLDELFKAQTEKMGQQNKKIMEALAAQTALTKMLIKQDEAANNLAKLFPINSEEALIELEKQIEQNSKNVYLAAIKDIIKKNIYKNIGLIISEDLLYTFNTDGTHGKKRLKDFANFYDVLKEAVKADADIDDVEGAIRKAISLIKKRYLKKILKERSIQTHTDNV